MYEVIIVWTPSAELSNWRVQRKDENLFHGSGCKGTSISSQSTMIGLKHISMQKEGIISHFENNGKLLFRQMPRMGKGVVMTSGTLSSILRRYWQGL